MTNKEIVSRIRKLADVATKYALNEKPRSLANFPTTMEIVLSHFNDLADEIEAEEKENENASHA